MRKYREASTPQTRLAILALVPSGDGGGEWLRNGRTLFQGLVAFAIGVLFCFLLSGMVAFAVGHYFP